MSHSIKPMMAPGVEPGMAPTGKPEFLWIDPQTLLVDDTYQRELSRASLDLIYKIIRRWDWARFKPPVVALTADGYEVIDGQHTAIAAASHPELDTIPVMVVGAPEHADRARAFVGHNKDRLLLGPVSIHYANLAAGDEDALTLQQVCDRAGVTLLRYPPGNGVFKPGETIAIRAITALINRHGALGARIVLQVLAEAHCAPVRADGMKAVEALLYDPEYKDQVQAKDVTTALIALGPKAEQEAKVFAAAHNIHIWRGLTVILFREARRGRRRAA